MSKVSPTGFNVMARVPRILVGAVLLHALILGWLWWHRFPMSTADSIAFKQPAYMHLHTGHFSLPTYVGRGPHTDLVFACYSPVYICLNWLAFRLFGFSLAVSLGLDFFVHFVLATLMGALLWKINGNQWLASIVVLTSPYLLIPVGRPEELGILLALTAVILVSSQRRWSLPAAVVCLGLLGATSPGAAILGVITVVIFDTLLAARISWKRMARVLAVVLVSPCISLLLWYAFVHPYLSEAIEQYSELAATGMMFLDVSYWKLSGQSPLWGVFSAVSALLAFGFSVSIVLRRPPAEGEPTWMKFVKTMALVIPAAFALNYWARRLSYDYRLLNCVDFALVTLLAAEFLSRHVRRRWLAAGLYAATIVLGMLPARDLVRFAVAPLLWNNDSVSYDQVVARIRATVPANASVGGDGALWAVVDDGRPYYAIRWLAADHWPDYLLATTFTKVPYIFQVKGWRDTIAKSYVEVSPGTSPAAETCTCEIAGVKVPVATGRCDWAVRIWKRRGAQDVAP